MKADYPVYIVARILLGCKNISGIYSKVTLQPSYVAAAGANCSRSSRKNWHMDEDASLSCTLKRPVALLGLQYDSMQQSMVEPASISKSALASLRYTSTPEQTVCKLQLLRLLSKRLPVAAMLPVKGLPVCAWCRSRRAEL